MENTFCGNSLVLSCLRSWKNATHPEPGGARSSRRDNDDDDGRTETVQTEQLGASSSDKTLQQGLADGQSRAVTVDSAPDVLAAGQHRHGKRAKKAPPDTQTGRSVYA